MNNFAPSLFFTSCRFALAVLACSGPLLVACDKDNDEPTTAYGPKVQVGSGTARSFVATDANGTPTEIGVAVSEASLNSLPATPAIGTMYDVALPTTKATAEMPFDHISFDWNPTGHEPIPIYTLPHFDAHFYMQPTAVQHSITLDDPKGDIFPAANKLPAGYITPPNVAPGRTVPMMGRHWGWTPPAPNMLLAALSRTPSSMAHTMAALRSLNLCLPRPC